MNRRSFAVSSLLALPAAFIAHPEQARTPAQTEAEHEAWVLATLKEMLTIRPGMTRGDLLKVFKPEGGLAPSNRRTFYSRACLYFRVDVEFAVDAAESARDRILGITRPYLQIEIRLD